MNYFTKRIAAYLIDMVFATIGSAITMVLFMLFADWLYQLDFVHGYTSVWLYYFSMVFGGASIFLVLYFAFIPSQKGATYGMRLLKLRLRTTDDQTPSFFQAFTRFALFSISYMTLFMGIFMILFTDKKQGLHDRLTKTVVVDLKE